MGLGHRIFNCLLTAHAVVAAKAWRSDLKKHQLRRVAARSRGRVERISVLAHGKAALTTTMRKRPTKQPQPGTGELKGWKEIASFLGEPTSVVQRWANQDMPVRRQGRYVTTSAEELNQWLGRQSGKPVHVATDTTDLTAELKRGISFVRRTQKTNPAKHSRKG
jgi:hypothetical protein